MAITYLQDMLNEAAPVIDGQVFLVQSRRFPNPPRNEQVYQYKVVKDASGEYGVFPLVGLDGEIITTMKPIIYTQGDAVFYHVQSRMSPYVEDKPQYAEKKSYETKEHLVISAFLAWEHSYFRMTNAYVFSVGEPVTDVAAATTISVTDLTVTPATVSVKVGATAQLSVAVVPANATNTNVTYASADNGIATVANGTITGVAAGSTTVTVTSADSAAIKKTVAVTVTAA